MKRLVFACALLAAPLWAQDAETLADIRQDLTVLNVEITKLKRELSTTGGASVPAGGSVLDRVDAIETALQGLTAKTEELEFRLNRVIEDGTNRIGDLEFRLVELEGGDISQLGETSTLGGDDIAPQPVAAAPAPAPDQPEQQVAAPEADDFERAKQAYAAGQYADAAAGLERFNELYPGSPFAVDVFMLRGDALKELGDTREASRSYLAAYNAAPDGTTAPTALLKLGQGLADLAQTDAACQILSQLTTSFAATTEATEGAQLAASLSCG